MNEAAAAEPSPAPAWDSALMMQIMSRLGAVHEAVLRDIEVQGGKIELMLALDGLADAKKVMIDAKKAMIQGTMARTMAELEAPEPEPVPEPVPAPVRHRHRAPRQRPDWLRPVKGVIPAGGVVTALRHLAHPGPAVAGAATVALAATVSAAPAARPAVRHVPAAAAPAQAGIDEGAVPVPPAPSSAVPSPDARSAHRARHARPPAQAKIPPAALSPAPPPSPPPPPPALPGVLSADRPVVAMGTTRTARIALSATGAPVTWSCEPVAGLVLPGLGGVLEPGTPAQFVIDVAGQSQAGQAVVTLEPGDIAITVTWDAAPDPSPSVLPS